MNDGRRGGDDLVNRGETRGTTSGTNRGRRATVNARPVPLALGAIAVVATLGAAVGCSTPTSSAVAAPPPAATAAPAPGTSEETSTTTTEAPPPPTEPGTTTTTRKPRRPPTGPPGPLTGAPVDLPGYENRQALVVKIDNYDPDARPQAGLTLADVVYEEKVEGPVSRFAAIFQGSDADQIGPVRSARSTDVEIIGDLNHPLFAYSGANGGFTNLLSISPLVDVGAGAKPGAYWRGGDKVMPHNLYTSTALLYAGTAGLAPKPLWPFRGATDPPGPGAQAASAVSYHFGGNVTAVTWRWDPAENAWFRTQNGTVHYDLGNWPESVSNVVVMYVPYQNSISDDMFGHPIPEASLGGEGRGFVMTGGAAIPMNWSRLGLENPATYTGPDGQPIRFAPGRTWVALIPVEYRANVQLANGTAIG